MKKLTMVIVGLLCAFMMAAQGPTPPSNLEGQDLREWFKANWYDGNHNQIGYTNARRKMYNYIDNHDNSIEDVYTGFIISWTYGGTGTNPQPLNCEHTVPQSFFSYLEPMKSDLHHLFPVHGSANSSRSNNPFAEIADLLTTKWWLNGSSQTTIPSSNIDDYSEYYAGQFEPREEHKGNAARAIFYFYTMYPTQAGNISQIGNIETLYAWHLSDPVDADEIARNAAIEYYQGDRNPYIDYPEMVAVAWGFTTPTSELFISEYVEGSSYNKAIEIVNLTGSTVYLSDYFLKKQTNGSGNWTSGLNLNGTLANGETYVVAHSSAGTVLSQEADLLTSNSSMSFNGNDPVALFHNSSLVDIVGDFDGGSSYFASNTTLRRNTSITDPNTTYTTSEWDSYASNTFSDIGQYGTPKAVPAALASTVQTSTFPNPFLDQITLELDGEWKAVVQAEIMDIHGRQVWNADLESGTSHTISTMDFPAGIYVLQVQDGYRRTQQRIVKQQ